MSRKRKCTESEKLETSPTPLMKRFQHIHPMWQNFWIELEQSHDPIFIKPEWSLAAAQVLYSFLDLCLYTKTITDDETQTIMNAWHAFESCRTYEESAEMNLLRLHANKLDLIDKNMIRRVYELVGRSPFMMSRLMPLMEHDHKKWIDDNHWDTCNFEDPGIVCARCQNRDVDCELDFYDYCEDPVGPEWLKSRTSNDLRRLGKMIRKDKPLQQHIESIRQTVFMKWFYSMYRSVFSSLICVSYSKIYSLVNRAFWYLVEEARYDKLPLSYRCKGKTNHWQVQVNRGYKLCHETTGEQLEQNKHAHGLSLRDQLYYMYRTRRARILMHWLEREKQVPKTIGFIIVSLADTEPSVECSYDFHNLAQLRWHLIQHLAEPWSIHPYHANSNVPVDVDLHQRLWEQILDRLD